MLRDERVDDILVAVRAALQGWQAGIWTALPAIVQAYDTGKMTVSAQPAIQARVRAPDGTESDQNLPLCVDCPVQWPGGGGYVLTFPLKPGNEGILLFARACIDGWWQSGGVQKQAELRMHDLSDGMFIPLIFSNGKVPPNVSADTVQLRSVDGEGFIELADGHVCNIRMGGGVNITGNVSIDGALGISGNITALDGTTYTNAIKTAGDIIGGFGTGDQVGLKTHTHTQPNDSHGDAEPPTSAPTGGT
jgi:hypothetical protein